MEVCSNFHTELRVLTKCESRNAEVQSLIEDHRITNSIYSCISHCDTHYIAIYQGLPTIKTIGGSNTTSSTVVPPSERLATICGSNKQEDRLIFSGPNLLLEFKSGNQIPPFNYNGFAALIEFIEATPLPSTTTTAVSHSSSFNFVLPAMAPASSSSLDVGEWTTTQPKFTPCDKVITEANGRSGHFDTRGRPYSANCRLIFKGRLNDVVHISLFNYRLKYVYIWNLKIISIVIHVCTSIGHHHVDLLLKLSILLLTTKSNYSKCVHQSFVMRVIQVEIFYNHKLLFRLAPK